MALVAQIVLTDLGLAALAALILVGYAAVYLNMRRDLARTVEKLRAEWAEKLTMLMIADRLQEKEAMPAQAGKVAAAPPVPIAPSPAIAKGEVSPDTLLVIAAAVTASLGKKVRLRSAKMLYSHESFNPWSQQGRAVVHASHNVAQRVH
jgi:hypothetical protein